MSISAFINLERSHITRHEYQMSRVTRRAERNVEQVVSMNELKTLDSLNVTYIEASTQERRNDDFHLLSYYPEAQALSKSGLLEHVKCPSSFG